MTFFLSSQVHRVELTLLSDFWGWRAWSSMVWEMFSFAFFLFSLFSIPTAVARVLKWEYLEICTLLLELRVSCMGRVTMLAPEEKPMPFKGTISSLWLLLCLNTSACALQAGGPSQGPHSLFFSISEWLCPLFCWCSWLVYACLLREERKRSQCLSYDEAKKKQWLLEMT